MKRWMSAIVVGPIIVLVAVLRPGAAHGGAVGAPAGVALDSLRPLRTSAVTSANNYSSVAVITHTNLTTYNGKHIDHGLMFGLLPGHGGPLSEADITFHLGKKYQRLSGMAFSNDAASPAPRVIEIQDVSGRTTPPKDLLTESVDQSGRLSFSADVRGINLLRISASTSFDCVCDSAASILVVGTLTPR